MKRFHFLIFLLILLPLAFVSMNAQRGIVAGKVIDKQTNQPLTGATVMLVEQAKAGKQAGGAIAKGNGEYSIRNIEPGNYLLRVQYIGYKNFEKKVSVAADATVTVDVQMFADVIGLDQVVVTGVASRNEKAIADVSVSRVDAATLQEGNVYQDLSQIMTGKVSGVFIEPSSGNVGGGIRFNVRGGGGLNGSGQPVIYVDGTRISNVEIGFDINGQFASTLADINPEDVESIEVLKGPAGAALYGTSGSNGVVLIKTKRGRGAADFFSLDYKYVTGWNENTADYSGPDPGADGKIDYLTLKYNPGDILSYKDANKIFRDGYLNEHSLSFSGKSGIFNYFVNYTNRDEQGIVIQNDYSRESVRANFEVLPSKEFKIKVSGNYVWSHNTRPINDNNVMGWLGNTLLFPISYRFTDSIAVAHIQNSIDNNRFIGSGEISYMPEWLPGFSANALIGYDGYNYINEEFYSPVYWYTGPGDIGEKNLGLNDRKQLNYDLNARYDYTITEGLEASSIIGAQLTSITSKFTEVSVQNFANSKIRNLNAAADLISADDGLSDFRDAGIYFQQDMRFQDAYFLNLAVRQDYASALGEDPPTIFYPKASGAIRLDRLGIDMDGMFSLFKVRAGWGQSGVLPGSLAAYPLRWAGGQSGFGVGALINSIGNPDIKPERINEIEVGLELELFDSYGIDFTYYNQSGDESILNLPNAPSTGLTATGVPQNIGGIKTWGFESLIYAMPIRTSDYELRFDFIWNYQQNEITSLGGLQPIANDAQGWYEHQPRSAFMVNKVIGPIFDPETGKYLGSEVTDDLEYAGTPVPVHTGSLATTFRFLKNFTFYFMFDWALGHTVYNMTREFQINFGNDVEYKALTAKLASQTPGTAEYIATATELSHLDPNRVANLLEKADWLRLREISLRVNCTEWVQMFLTDQYIKSFNLIASVRNAAIFSGYNGADPTVNFSGSRTTVTRGTDFLTLQNARTVNFTFSIGL